VDREDGRQRQAPEDVDQRGQLLRVVHVARPVCRHDQIPPRQEAVALEHAGLVSTRSERETDVRHDVADQRDVTHDPLGAQVLDRHLRRAQEQLGEMVSQHAVSLFRHVEVERAHAGLDVSQWDLEPCAGERAGESRVGVAVDEPQVGTHALEHRLQRVHDAADLVRVRSRPDSEVMIGARQAQLAEEHSRQLLVVVLAAVDEHLLVPAPQAPRNRSRLHELRAVADQRDYPHGASKVAKLRLRLVRIAPVCSIVMGAGILCVSWRKERSGPVSAWLVTSSGTSHTTWLARHLSGASARKGAV
jgi:hypothetical protein